MTDFVVKYDDWQVINLSIVKDGEEHQLSIFPLEKDFMRRLENKGLKKILELGSGSGRIARYFAENHFEVVATDISEEAVKGLRKKCKQQGIDKVKVLRSDFRNLDFADGFFDAIIARSTLHHARLDGIKQGIEEAYRVLKPGGYFMFDLLSKDDSSFGAGSLVEENTYLSSRKGEEGIIHHYTDLEELGELLANFTRVEIYQIEYRIEGLGEDYYSRVYDIIAKNR